MRLAEPTGLTVSSVDYLPRTIKVEQQILTPAVGAPQLTTRLKTKASYRTIPVSTDVIEALARHLEMYGPGPGSVIFTDAKGNTIRRQRLSEIMNAAALAAGVSATYHDFRHFAASRFLSAGVSVRATAEVLGHSPTELLHTYAHFMHSVEDRVRVVMRASAQSNVPQMCPIRFPSERFRCSEGVRR
jgi:integrase